jgi:hypothetical protein
MFFFGLFFCFLFLDFYFIFISLAIPRQGQDLLSVHPKRLNAHTFSGHVHLVDKYLEASPVLASTFEQAGEEYQRQRHHLASNKAQPRHPNLPLAPTATILGTTQHSKQTNHQNAF